MGDPIKTSPSTNTTSGKKRDPDAPLVNEDQIEGSMHTEEPMGSDQAPQGHKPARERRHPRPDGVGGLVPADEEEPNVDEKTTG